MSQNSPTPSPEQRQAAQPIQVLHVDDEPGFAELASEFLSREDDSFVIHTETSPDDALDFLRNNSVDCLVSDYDMPGRNGLDLLRAVREEYNNLPFILFTGKGSEEIASEAISAGVDEYLQKGRGSDQYTVLANRIKNVTSKRRAERDLENRVRQQEVVAEFGQHALSSDDLQELFENAVRHVADTLGNEYAKVLDWRPEYGDLRLVAGVGWRDGLVGDATVGDGLDSQAGYTLRSEEPIIVDDLRSEERFSGPPLLIEHEVVSGISVIIGDFDAPWGVFGTHTTNRKAFTQDDVAFVQGIANVLANAIERKKLDAELTDAVDQYQTLVEQNVAGIYILREDGLEYVNPRFCETFGYSEEELLSIDISELIAAESRELVEENVRKRLAGELDETEYTATVIRDDGTPIHVRVHGTRIEYEGEPAILGTLVDITEQIELKEQLEREQKFHSQLLDMSPVGIVVLDADGNIERANQQAEEELRLSKDEITSRTYNDPVWTILDENGEKLRDEEYPFKRVLDTGEPIFDARHGVRWPDGTHRLLSVNAAPVRTESGEIERVIAAIRDVTEQREYEQTIEQQNEQLEEFASVVSHDLRNPLNVAQGWVNLSQEECDSEHLDAASDSLEQAQALIDDLLSMAREGERVRDIEAVDLADAVENAWRNVKTEEATLVTNTERTIQADRGQLQRLLENLLRNAVEHGGADVTVTINDLDDGFYVADDGAGIPKEVGDQVFEAGYSTSDTSTGFGLNIVKQIVDAHGWNITVTDNDEGGACFEITGV